jgi:hypothetical protein
MSESFLASPSVGDGSSARANSVQTSIQNPFSITALDSVNTVKANFDKLDSDRDNYLTAKEVNWGANNLPYLTPKDRLAIEAFTGAVPQAQKASNDEWGSESSGVTRDDLNYLSRSLPRYSATKALLEQGLPGANVRDARAFGIVANNSFARMDENHDGKVVKDELDRFSANSANTLEQREVAKVMSAHFDEFKSISNEGGASDREVGPFASKHAGSDGITSSDTTAFEQYIARPGLESFIWDRRQDKLVERADKIAFTTGLGGAFGLFVLSAPGVGEVVIAGGIAALPLMAAGGLVHESVNDNAKDIRAEAQARRQMLSSWQYFEPQRKWAPRANPPKAF